MYYEWAIAVPANTLAAAPVETVLELTAGVIVGLEVQFPAGCAGLAHCKILHWESQKWPTPPSTSFASDGHAIVVPENYELSTPPYDLRVVAWNLDDTYAHTIYLRIALLRGPGAVLINRVFTGLAKFLALVGIK